MPDIANLLSYRRAGRVRLDPRTALLALVVVNVVSLSAGFAGPTLWARVTVGALAIALLATARHPWAALVCLLATAVALLTESAGLTALADRTPTGAVGWVVNLVLLVLGALANLLARFLPVVLTGWWVITTIRVGELMGALARLRLPRALVIPLAVVLRMVPVLAAESTAIGQSARTRGLRIGLARPRAIIDYRVVPLALRTVDIGDELTQAAFTRGLEARGERTTYGRIGFRWPDAVVLLVCAGAILLFAWGA